MNVTDSTTSTSLDGDQKRKATDNIDELGRLFSLIQLHSSDPAKVEAYTERGNTLLVEMKTQLLAEEEANNANIASDNGSVRILVIDDESSVATTMAIVFSKAGYDSRAVPSAEAALELLAKNEWIPQLAIIDVHLPGLNGIDLAILLKTKHPQLRVCLFSGRAATSDLLDAALAQGHNFEVLAKPIHPTVFLGMAASILGPSAKPLDVPAGANAN